MNPFETKSIYIPWPDNIGEPEKIAAKLKEGGFEAALLHSVSVKKFPTDISRELVEAIRAQGIAVIGSAAIYGFDPSREGSTAAQLVNDMQLDGFSFDAETQFDNQPKPNSNAVKVLMAYKAACDKPSAWTSWAFPSFHVPDVVRAAMELADVGSPMAYWNPRTTADDAAHYLRKSLEEWARWTDKPIFPAGRAYIGDNGKATPEGVQGFANEAQVRGLKGITWWSLYHAVKLPDVWDALKQTPGMKPIGDLPFQDKLPVITE